MPGNFLAGILIAGVAPEHRPIYRGNLGLCRPDGVARGSARVGRLRGDQQRGNQRAAE
jgi:hypothetical protein